MPIHRRRPDAPHRTRRLVHAGEMFTSDELDRDEVELVPVDPGTEPADPAEEDEPWGLIQVVGRAAMDRLRDYRAAHPADPDAAYPEQEAPDGDA